MMKTLFTLFTVLVGFSASAGLSDNDSHAPLKNDLNPPDRVASVVWHVGPSRDYKKPSEVAALVQDGDIIEIDAGDYVGDVARWSQDNLTFRGVGGIANLDANYRASGRKAIWVIAGDNAIVENIRFANCKDKTDVDKNWAGIRAEGTNLTVRNCIFYNNSDGILCGKNLASDIVITHTTFEANGHGDGQSHNLYIGQINSLTFTYNYSHRAVVGHELKSRAVTNYILYNRISDEDGTASRLIDLPQGGVSIVMGNVLQQGANVSQRNMLGYGLEGANEGPEELYVVNNTFVNDHENVARFIDVGANTELFKAYNNIFAGPHSTDPEQYFVYRSAATVRDISHNLFEQNPVDAGLKDPANIDYHLVQGSEAIGAGTDAGVASNGFGLTPLYEYVHPADGTAREGACNISLGAYEYGTNEPPVVSVVADKPVVYYGYAPEATAILTASATSDRAPFTYTWSTGDTGASIAVSPATTTVYTVTVTDAVGCQQSANVTVEVVDVRCGPMEHQKVVVCNRAGQELCIDANAVPAHLQNGGTLGSCDVNAGAGERIESATEGLVVEAFPNPFSEQITIALKPQTEQYVIVEVYDLDGSLIKRLYEGTIEPGGVRQVQLNGAELKEGLHIGKIITKGGVETIYLMVRK